MNNVFRRWSDVSSRKRRIGQTEGVRRIVLLQKKIVISLVINQIFLLHLFTEFKLQIHSSSLHEIFHKKYTNREAKKPKNANNKSISLFKVWLVMLFHFQQIHVCVCIVCKKKKSQLKLDKKKKKH